MPDAVIPHTRLLQAHKVNVLPWPTKSPDLNPVENNWDIVGRVVRRRCLANVNNLHVQYFVMDGWNRITHVAHVECLRLLTSIRSRCQTKY